ncbi:MAG: Cytochrome c5 [uncultured Thiotrichaceae bacterium]|uniref:Cytochrome c5 n=1 Tax=uncultured Thiotrichaceae bacterium TaxID=298394 RepID=A0A6S6S712_9GAMM|nr:MAG: Cytochrome c5 [uncultured Thiotrichaceae bacterium]
MASTHDDTLGKYKLYSGIAIGGVLLAAMLDSCSTPSDEEKLAEANKQTAQVTETATANVDENTVEQNLAPIETLVVVDKNAPVAPARSGEAVYQSACLACHAAGVLQAPKLEAGAWDSRIAKGLDGLTLSAINGINAMPARGGNPAITDEEMTNAVSYMLKTAGYDMAGDTAPAQQAATEDTTKAAVATATVAAVATAVVAQAAAPEVAQAEPVTPPEAPESPQAPVAPQAPEQDTHKVASQKYITDGSLGKQVYQNTCFTCHDVGIANAPVIGDTAVWQQLMSAGVDSLYATALNGKGVKPPKGGHASLSIEQVKAAVDYMLETAGVSTAEAATQEAAPTEAAQEAVAKEAAPAETTQAPVTEEAVAQEPAVEEAAPAQEAVQEPAAKEEETPAQETVAPAEAAPVAAVKAGLDGEKIYRGLCFSCHDAGIANSPKLGDKAAWAPRIAAGAESMYANSINGIGIMPAKGGNPALSDDEIKAAVDWMVQQSQ